MILIEIESCDELSELLRHDYSIHEEFLYIAVQKDGFWVTKSKATVDSKFCYWDNHPGIFRIIRKHYPEALI